MTRFVSFIVWLAMSIGLSPLSCPAQTAETTGQSEKSSSPRSLKYGDEQPDGKKSLAGTGEMIRFTLPGEKGRVRGLRLHAARYGYPKPPKESAVVTLLDADGTGVLHTELVPYAKFKRGESKWMVIPFKKPVEVGKEFWVTLDFKAEARKGVYVSYDTSTGGQHSRIGLPGQEAREVDFDGDWMIQALMAP